MEDVEATREEALAALGAVLNADVIGPRSRLRGLLRYLVQETIEGRGERISAYAVGVDVLGRDEEFDPNTDSIVRVEVNRLRQALAAYYAGPGVDDPIWITLPAGQYAPRFVRKAPPQPDPPEASPSLPKPRGRDRRVAAIAGGTATLAAIAGGVAALAALGIGVFFGMREEAPTSFNEAPPPMVEVAEFHSLHRDRDFNYLADGVRALLISDLSHFRTLRVRKKPAAEAVLLRDLRPADFRIEGSITRPGDAFRLHLSLIDATTLQVLWSADRSLPSSHGGLHALYVEQVHAIAGQLASPSGKLVAESIRRLDAATGESDARSLSAYQCLIAWHAYDLTKTPRAEQRARACLNAQVEADTGDGGVWAAYAFMSFLDWARQGDGDRAALADELAAARKAIRLDPGNADAHEYLGSIQLAVNEYDAAAEAYARAISYNPSKPDLRLLQGWVACIQGASSEGVEAMREGVRLSPAPPGWFYIPISMCLFQEGDYDEALAMAEAAIEAGDGRGHPLALAAAAKAGAEDAVARHLERYQTKGSDPLAPIIGGFNIPRMIDKYEETLAPFPVDPQPL